MEWITNHLGLPTVSSTNSLASQAKGSQYLETILLAGKMDKKMVNHPSQLDSSFSFKGDEESILCQWQFSMHQNLEKQVNTMLDNVGKTSIKGYVKNCVLTAHVENIEHRQLNPNASDMQPSRLASPWTKEDYCLSDERFRFLLDDPKLLQELLCEENLRASSSEINLSKNYSNCEHPAFQLVAFSRLCRLYQSVFKPISIRLSYSDTTPVILVMNSKDAHQFVFISTEITEIQDPTNCTEIPFIISELLSNSVEKFMRPRHILIGFNPNYECWELVGCLDNFDFETTTLETPFEHPSDVVLVSVEHEDCVTHLSYDHDIGVEASTETADTDLHILYESTDAATRQHFNENSEEKDYRLLQDRLERQIFSCPTFIFPSLIAMMSSSISSDEDGTTPKEKEPEIAQVKSKLNKMFKCETCEKEFCNRNSFKTHQVIHNPAKWKQCFYCDYKTPRSITMRNHVARFHWFHSQKNIV